MNEEAQSASAVAVATASDSDVTGAVEKVLALCGGMKELVSPGDRVLIKPNLVAPFSQATTDLRIIAAVVRAVQEAGAEPVIAESAGFEFDTGTTFELLGLTTWAAENDVPLLALDAQPFERVPTGVPRLPQLEIASLALNVDVLINLPKLKRHNYTQITLGIKNLMGLVSRESRRQMHIRGLEAGISALPRLIPPTLTLLDALTLTSRAVYGSTQEKGLVLGSRDWLALDHYACRLLALEPWSIAHLRLAASARAGDVAYQIRGQISALPQPEAVEPSVMHRLYKVIFRGMYILDRPYVSLTGRSLIPAVHYWLGIRPHIQLDRCTHCGACAEACPAGAIDVVRGRIRAQRCMHVRCLRCREACPKEAIVLHGWRRPRED